MKNYTFRYTKDGETYLTGGYGRTAEEALEHERFWWPELPSIDQMELKLVEDVSISEEEAYGEERFLKALWASKEAKDAAKAKVAGCGACESDKEWMREIIDSEEPQRFMFADTAVREWLIDTCKG